MRTIMVAFCILALIAALATLAGGQQGKTSSPKKTSAATITVVQRDKPLVFTEAIPLENAKGRFDHFAIGGRQTVRCRVGQQCCRGDQYWRTNTRSHHNRRSRSPGYRLLSRNQQDFRGQRSRQGLRL